ncbi:unnamed protein product, partial [Didymodactylos carnosus]
FDFDAGVVAPPPNCMAANDACNLIFVKLNNPMILCTSEIATATPSKVISKALNKPVTPFTQNQHPYHH